jgi:hypothetical protein
VPEKKVNIAAPKINFKQLKRKTTNAGSNGVNNEEYKLIEKDKNGHDSQMQET